MARNTNNIDYRDDYYKGFARIYFNKILKTIINYGKLKTESGIILDFGCGVGHLKKTLKKNNIVGYDIIPELTEISNYKNIKASKIVLSGVLEHLYLDETTTLLKDFRRISAEADLLIYLPTENFFSKIAMHLAGEKNAHDDHVSKYKEINKIIEKYYKLKKRKYIFFHMAQISIYTPIK